MLQTDQLWKGEAALVWQKEETPSNHIISYYHIQFALDKASSTSGKPAATDEHPATNLQFLSALRMPLANVSTAIG